jgi:hypothetical protein
MPALSALSLSLSLSLSLYLSTYPSISISLCPELLFLFLKMKGALATFSYLVVKVLSVCHCFPDLRELEAQERHRPQLRLPRVEHHRLQPLRSVQHRTLRGQTDPGFKLIVERGRH